MVDKYALVRRSYDNKLAVAQWKEDANGNFICSEGVYLAERTDKTTWFDYPETPYGKTKNVSCAIYHTINEMLNDKWQIIKR